MILEGVVSNVANFGAFVDIGVHQDGLVHISALTDGFISDPRDVVKTGEVVKVKVVEVDIARKRISLTMRLNDEIVADKNAQSSGSQRKDTKPQHNKGGAKHRHQQRAQPTNLGGGMADAFAAAMAKQKK